MTVCIAALYGGCGGSYLVSDQMTTAHFPIGYEFESEDISKIIKLNDKIYALTAGDVIFASEVIEAAREKLNDGSNTVTVSHAAENVRKTYQEIRKRHIIRNELESRGLDLDTYYENQQKLVPPIIQMVDEQLRTWNPEVEIIVAGKDNSGCHIYAIRNPGDTLCHDSIGFVAIGSGAPHALYSLIESNYKKTMDKDEVIRLVKQAKLRSEVAPGVGAATSEVFVE
ncbi:hypothetical protein ACFLWY_00085 [Chloroflexota bacterium]